MDTSRRRKISTVFRCLRCEWRGDDPSSRVSLDSYEFWGERGSHIAHELSCPDCGDDVEETVACAECSERLVEVSGTDFCKVCFDHIQQEELNDLREAARARSRADLRNALIDITRSAA